MSEVVEAVLFVCVGCREKLPADAFGLNKRGNRKGKCKQCYLLRKMRRHQHASFTVKTAKVRKRLEAGEDVALELYYSPRPSEFEIQAYLYRHLREMGHMARGEVRPRPPAARGGCRCPPTTTCGGGPTRWPKGG